jgi:hypothetical protein
MLIHPGSVNQKKDKMKWQHYLLGGALSIFKATGFAAKMKNPLSVHVLNLQIGVLHRSDLNTVSQDASKLLASASANIVHHRLHAAYYSLYTP